MRLTVNGPVHPYIRIGNDSTIVFPSQIAIGREQNQVMSCEDEVLPKDAGDSAQVVLKSATDVTDAASEAAFERLLGKSNEKSRHQPAEALPAVPERRGRSELTS